MNSTWNNKVLSDVLGADEGAALRVKQVALVLVGVLVLAVAAKIKVPMWPVPITMGTFAVLMCLPDRRLRRRA
jgi:biotin transport system substrate-specific component